jgi:hypothetical protein
MPSDHPVPWDGNMKGRSMVAAAAQIPPYGSADGHPGPFDSERLLTSLDVEQATMLARKRGNVQLDALVTLPAAIARILASHRGTLSLPALETVAPDACAALARHRGNLLLDGLRELSAEQATALLDHRDWLGLDGLESVSDEVATLLCRHFGVVSLQGARTLSKRALDTLRSCPHVRLHAALAPTPPDDRSGGRGKQPPRIR